MTTCPEKERDFSTSQSRRLFGVLRSHFVGLSEKAWPLELSSIGIPLAGAVLGVSGLFCAVAVAGRPALWAVGPKMLWLAACARLGTAAPVLALGLAFYLPFLVSARLSRRGEALAAGQLGQSSFWAFWVFAPQWILVVGLALAAVWVAEPAAWRAQHQVKGTALASTLSWAELDRGLLVQSRSGLRAIRPHGGQELVVIPTDADWSFQSTGLIPLFKDSSWHLKEPLLDFEGGRWTAKRVTLRPQALGRRAGVGVSSLRHSTFAPRSPRAASFGELLGRLASEDHPAGRAGVLRERSLLAVHRRFALPLACLPLLWLGWALPWSAGMGRRRGSRAGLLSIVLTVGVFALERGLDRATAASLLPGILAAWLPLFLLLGLSLLPLILRHRRRNGFARGPGSWLFSGALGGPR